MLMVERFVVLCEVDSTVGADVSVTEEAPHD